MLFILVYNVADPATSLASNSVLEDRIFLWNQIVYSVTEKININCYLINMLNITILSSYSSIPLTMEYCKICATGLGVPGLYTRSRS